MPLTKWEELARERVAAEERTGPRTPVLGVTGIERVTHFVGFVIVLTGFATALWGFLLLALQVIYWLKTDIWVSFPVLALIVPTDVPIHLTGWLEPSDLVPSFAWNGWVWLQQPRDWLGLHAVVIGVLRFVPLSLVLIIAGALIWFAGIVLGTMPWENETRRRP